MDRARRAYVLRRRLIAHDIYPVRSRAKHGTVSAAKPRTRDTAPLTRAGYTWIICRLQPLASPGASASNPQAFRSPEDRCGASGRPERADESG